MSPAFNHTPILFLTYMPECHNRIEIFRRVLRRMQTQNEMKIQLFSIDGKRFQKNCGIVRMVPVIQDILRIFQNFRNQFLSVSVPITGMVLIDMVYPFAGNNYLVRVKTWNNHLITLNLDFPHFEYVQGNHSLSLFVRRTSCREKFSILSL